MGWRDRAEPVASGATGSWRDRAEPLAAAKPKASVNHAEALAQGIGQGYSLGYMPQLQAAAEEYITDPLLRATGHDVPEEDFVARRDRYIDRDKSLQESGAYTAGNLGAAIAMPMPGAGAIKGAGLLARAGRAATTAAGAGAAQGLIMNPGDSKGEIAPIQATDRLANAVGGGLIGGTLAKGGKALANSPMMEAADALTIKAMGGMKGQFEKLMKKGRMSEVAKYARDKGLVGWGTTSKHAMDGADEILSQTGPKIKQVYSSAQEKINDPEFLANLTPEQLQSVMDSGFAPEQIAKQIGGKLESRLKNEAGGKAVLSRVAPELETLGGLDPNIDVEGMYNYRKSLDNLINYDKPIQDMAGGQQALSEMRHGVQDRINNRINVLDDVGGTGEMGLLKGLNKDYQNASDIQAIAQKATAGEDAKMVFGLPELLVSGGLGVGAAGADYASGGDPTSSIAKGLGSAALFKMARQRGPAFMAKLLEKSAPVVQGAGRGLMRAEPAITRGLLRAKGPDYE